MVTSSDIVPNASNIVITDVNPNNGTATNTTTINLTSYGYATGGEFNATGDKFYFGISNFDGTGYGSIYYYDLVNSSINQVAGTTGYGRSQIELGWDGNIHASNGTNIITITPTNSIGAPVTLSSVPVYLIYATYLLPDQIDGLNYDDLFLAPIGVSIPGTGDFCTSAVITASINPGNQSSTSYLWSTGATSQSITVTQTGTYSVTVTDQKGCTASATKVMTKRPTPIIAPLTTDYTNRCIQQGSISLSASQGVGNQAVFSSYLWSSSPASNVTGLTSSSVSAAPQNQATTYTVTVTSNFGCTAAQFITINWNNNCCNGSTITCNSTTKSLTYGDVNLSKIYQDVCGTGNVIDLSLFGTDRRIAVNGVLWVDGNYTFRNCTYTNTNPAQSGGIVFAPTGIVVVPNTRTLNIDNSYLFACGTSQWYGIQVAVGGTLNTANNSLIADALAGVNGYGGSSIGYINLSNTRFFRNWVSVNMPGGASYTGRVNGCTFKFDPADPLSNFQLAPHAGQRPAIGISSNNSSGNYWQIPDLTGGVANTFNGINTGIQAYFANVRVNNNNFTNIRNYNNNGTNCGKAVYAQSSTTTPFGKNVWVQTNTNLGSPAFTNSDYGVYATTANAVVQNNKMQNVSYGIYGIACQGHTLNFNTNVIDQTLGGITFNSVLGAAALPSAVSNTINVIEPDLLNPVTYGIGHFEVNNSVVSCNGGTRDCRPLIELNNINHGRYGVQINNAYGTRVTNNTITQNNTVSTTQTKAAIYASGANMPLITMNSITGNGSVYDESANTSSAQRRSGLRMMNSTAEICNNTFNSIGYATEFIAGCNGTQLKQSQINACRYGVVLKNNGATQGVIGNQGAANLTHGNQFNGPFNNASNHRTFCFNSNGSNSPFWVIAPIASQQPEPNGATAGFSSITKGQSTSTTQWSCANYKSLIVTEGDLYAKEVAEGDAAVYMEYGFEESGTYMAERDLFNRLEDDHSLLQSQERYETFYAEKQNDAIGRMKAVDDAIYVLTDSAITADSAAFAAKWQQALALNNALPTGNVWELNRQVVNDIYLHTAALGIDTFSASQQQSLYSIASRCPYADGDAVYAARSLYNIIDHTAFFDDEEICNAIANYKKEQAKKLPSTEFKVSVAPNPANSFVDVVVKGSAENVLMTLYDYTGQVVGVAEVNRYVQLDVREFTRGIYLIQFTTVSGNKYSTPLVVTK